jgi:hypothetical protein
MGNNNAAESILPELELVLVELEKKKEMTLSEKCLLNINTKLDVLLSILEQKTPRKYR